MSKYKVPFFESIEDLKMCLESTVQCVNSSSWNSFGCTGAVCGGIDCNECLFSSRARCTDSFYSFLERVGCTKGADGKWHAPEEPKNVRALVRTNFICDIAVCPDGPCGVALPYRATPASVCIQGNVDVRPNWRESVSEENGEEYEAEVEDNQTSVPVSVAEFLSKFDEDADNERIVAELAEHYSSAELARFIVCDLRANGSSVQELVFEE